MGAGQSTATKIPPRALHVLRVTPSSPASQTSIEPFFDFLVGFKDENLAAGHIDAAALERIVESHEGHPLNLLVWNSKNQNTRGEVRPFSSGSSSDAMQWSQSYLRETGHFRIHRLTPESPSQNANPLSSGSA